MLAFISIDVGYVAVLVQESYADEHWRDLAYDFSLF
jgi:hypothetical protein